MNLALTPIFNKGNLVFKEIEKSVLIVSLCNEPKALLLEGMCYGLWSAIDGKRTIKDIMQILSDRFYSDDVEETVCESLNLLKDEGIVVF